MYYDLVLLVRLVCDVLLIGIGVVFLYVMFDGSERLVVFVF